MFRFFRMNHAVRNAANSKNVVCKVSVHTTVLMPPLKV